MFWVGPILGGVCGAFCFQFIFNVQRPRASIKDMEANMSMVNNSEEDMIDDLERVKQYRSNMMQVIKYILIHYSKYQKPNKSSQIPNLSSQIRVKPYVAFKHDAGNSCQMNPMHAPLNVKDKGYKDC